jgi:hypothetical protein
MNQCALPVIKINEMQKLYAVALKQEYREILNMHMTELMVLNYAHHVRNNDTYILRRAVHNIEHNHKMKQVSMFYISKTNLYSRPSNPASYRFANMAAYKNREYPVTIAGFEHDDDYHMRLLYEYTSIDFVN